MIDMLAWVALVTGMYAGACALAWQVFARRVRRRQPDADLTPLFDAFWRPWRT